MTKCSLILALGGTLLAQTASDSQRLLQSSMEALNRGELVTAEQGFLKLSREAPRSAELHDQRAQLRVRCLLDCGEEGVRVQMDNDSRHWIARVKGSSY